MDLKTRILATYVLKNITYILLYTNQLFFLALCLFTEKNNWASKNAGYFADLSDFALCTHSLSVQTRIYPSSIVFKGGGGVLQPLLK